MGAFFPTSSTSSAFSSSSPSIFCFVCHPFSNRFDIVHVTLKHFVSPFILFTPTAAMHLPIFRPNYRYTLYILDGVSFDLFWMHSNYYCFAWWFFFLSHIFHSSRHRVACLFLFCIPFALHILSLSSDFRQSLLFICFCCLGCSIFQPHTHNTQMLANMANEIVWR